ncbi:LOW QUALITY PROTEIN: uncharacterized protein LOC106088869 [Stomoxys calcitrans]|uniref:LOW QUALITY PROTEIN: uncharacterized protein LOC106088869 n=1 Tax=Stomoxys calcitrans TaxID=35570 RepID=UPI0027E33B09|nr:LOW QUALITY PROTEIN: uncharacterized protein LOC106088869 [Stomoxys calcitrans]
MFNSHKHLKRKTPCPGINREEFIQHLVDEYYTTNNIEAQEQVTANLANFAYDPLNWSFLIKADAVKLFLEILEERNEKLQLHGIAGLTNICLDDNIYKYFNNPEVIQQIHRLFLASNNQEILINCCTIYQFLAKDNKSNILPAKILLRVQNINTDSKGKNIRLSNITSLLLLDFGRRYEFTESQHNRYSMFRCLSSLSNIRQIKYVKVFSQQDLDQFSQLTGDSNSIHTDTTPVERRLVHGAFLNAIVAGLIGTHFPKGTIVLEQKFKFPKPCRVNENSEFELQLQQERKIAVVSYKCKQNEITVFEGEAKLLIPSINK